VKFLLDKPDRSQLGKGLSLLVNALYEKNNNDLKKAAEHLEFLCDEGYVTKKSESIFRLLSALAFEACGESYRSKRSYFKLFFMALPLEDAYDSMELAKLWTQILSHYGMREIKICIQKSERLFDEIKRQQEFYGIETRDFKGGNLIVSLGIIEFILSYTEYLYRKKNAQQLISKITSILEIAELHDTSSWLVIIAQLYSYVLESILDRSILNLKLPETVEARLFNRGITELWPPQNEAIKKGLLEKTNFVYSTGTATGKSLLAYLVAGTALPQEKVIYIVPTRTLALEAFNTLSELVHSPNIPVAITTRDKTEYDETLTEYAVITATYEKFYSLLKQKKIEETQIKSLVADEVHFISEDERGIQLEYALSKIKNKPIEFDPQIITLSAMIPDDDALKLSKWLSASLVKTNWTPVRLEEAIYHRGILTYKDGVVEQVIPANQLPPQSGTVFDQKCSIICRLVRDIIVDNGQCMIVVRSRKDSEKVANSISTYLHSRQFFDTDLRMHFTRDVTKREEFIQELKVSEPELPLCAKQMITSLNHGVAYHHAGLPNKYRELVERGIKKMAVKILVTTTTFEVGVNLPFSNVIFMDLRKGRRNMPLRTYKNLAGRAGRPEYDISGKSIMIALSEKEYDSYKQRYFLSKFEPLESGILRFLRKVPAARYAIQSEILEIISQQPEISLSELIFSLKDSWFWSRASDDEKKEFVTCVEIELWNLKNYGQINQYGEKIIPTRFGLISSKSMLSPFSIRNLVGNARRVFSGSYSSDTLSKLILSLVGIPYEIRGNDDYIKRVRTPKEFEFISEIIMQDQILTEPSERIAYCTNYATVLWYRINASLTEEILAKCGLDSSADAALIDELLPNDAFWILSALASIPETILNITRNQRDHIKRLAIASKFGTLDTNAQKLQDEGLIHMGRNSAIRISKYLKESSKGIKDLSENDLLEIFPNNPEAVKYLFDELQEKGLVSGE